VVACDALLPPLQCRQVICAGVNYRKHMRVEAARSRRAGWRPFFFLKAPYHLGHRPRDPIVISSAARASTTGRRLAVSSGQGRTLIPKRAGFHVAAYSVCNDITARGYHRRDATLRTRFRYDWFRPNPSRARCAGPGLTPAFLVPDPQDLRLRLWVNGELPGRVDRRHVCPVAELIAAASEVVTLEPAT